MHATLSAAALLSLASAAYAQLPSSAPSCVTRCYAAKIAEAPSYYGTTDISVLCKFLAS
jgi:hypothetical protein